MTTTYYADHNKRHFDFPARLLHYTVNPIVLGVVLGGRNGDCFGRCSNENGRRTRCFVEDPRNKDREMDRTTTETWIP
jgi:hypothetical protein